MPDEAGQTLRSRYLLMNTVVIYRKKCVIYVLYSNLHIRHTIFN